MKLNPKQIYFSNFFVHAAVLIEENMINDLIKCFIKCFSGVTFKSHIVLIDIE